MSERIVDEIVFCESCGDRAHVRLNDGSTWCDPCDSAAVTLGEHEGPCLPVPTTRPALASPNETSEQ